MTPDARKAGLLLAAALLVCPPARSQTAELVVQTGHQHEIRSVAFSPDGRQIITAGVGNGCKLWDTHSGQELRTLAPPPDADTPSNVDAAFFHPDGRRLFTVSGGVIKTWNAATGKLLNKFGKYQEFETVALSPDGSKFAVVRMSGSAMAVVDSTSGEEIVPLEYESHFVWERIDHLTFSPDSKTVAGGGHDNIVRLWSTKTGQQIGPPITDHTHWISAVAFSPDGSLVASGGSDDKVFLHDAKTRKLVRTLKASVSSLKFSPDGKELVGGGGDGVLRKWSVANGQETAEVQAHSDRFNSTLTAIDIDARTGLIVTASEDKTAKLWDLTTLEPVRTLAGVSSPTGYVAISPNGRDLVTSAWDGSVRIWSLDGLEPVRTVAAADSQVFDFSPDGRMLAMWDNGIALRDTATLGLIRTIDPRSSIVNGAFFTPDGKSIITDDERSVLKRWNVATGELEDTLFTQSTMEGAMGDNIARIAYSPDGKRFVSVTNNGKLAVRDAATKDVIFPLDGRLNSMRAMFSPDGREIVAGGYQTQELWFWDATTGKRLAHSTTPKWVNVNAGRYAVGMLGGVMVRAEVDEAKVRLREADSGKEIATLIPLNDTEWAVTTPEGRFDTNKPLDAVTGLAWIVSNDPMTPRPLELFLRQYYEPGLLRRLLSCPVLGNCATEFPKLPSIAGLKRARPSTAFRGAK